MAAGIIAFFTALPAFLQIVSQLGLLMQRLMAYAQTNNLNGWVHELETVIDELEAAKTPEQKLAGAQKLVGIVRGLGP